MHPSSPCPGVALLERYSSGELDRARSSEVEAHLLECGECSSRLERFRSAAPLDEPAELEGPAIPPFVGTVEIPSTQPKAPDRDQAPAPAHGGAPRRIGPYRLVGEIGAGGMGVVYEAIHEKLGKPVALKVLPPHAGRKGWVQRFEREMKALGGLDHPNVVRATDAGEADGTYYLAMDLIDGADLHALAARRGPLSVPDACEVTRQAAEGLAYAHARGTVHRDVKPSNLMLDRGGTVKLLDLGLALLAESAESRVTSGGWALGTFDYMAPEQASESHAVDPAADIYSLGCTLYHLLVGQPPYSDEGTTPLERLAAHAKRRVPALDRMRPDAPPALVRLAARMTDRRPARRPAAAEVASALEELARGSDLARLFLDAEGAVETRPHPSPTGPSVSRLRRATVALLVLVLCALAALSSPAVYRLVTNRGDLTVEVDDDVAGEVEVRVLGEDVTISSRTGWSVDLKAGAYRLALGGSSDEITLSQDRVEITRLGEVIVRVTSRKSTEPRAVEPSLARTEARPPPAAPAPAAPGTWKPGPPQSDVTSIGRSGPQALGGLVPRPAELPGVGRWQVETTFPRAASIGRWSPDGKRLASVSYQIVRLYDYGHDDGRLLPVACFDIDTWSAQDLRWSPDGSWIVAGHRLLNVRESRLGRVLAGAQSIGEWSPDSRWIATGSPDGIVRLESPEGETRDFSHQHSGAVSLLAWSPDGAWLASGGDDKTVRLWHADGRPGPTLEGHAASISALGWSADSRRLATGSEDSTVRVWSVEGTELATFRGHSSRIERLAFSPDGTRIASYDVRDAERSSFRLWDPDLGRTLLSLPRQGDERVTSFSFQPSGGWLATGAWDGAVRLWDPKEATAGPVLREARGLRDHAPAIGAIDWRPDGLVLATSAWDANTTLWSVESPEAAKEPVERLPGAMSHARHAAWSPDGEWIAVAGADRLVRVFRAATGELRGAWEGHDGPVNAVAWSADSERLASASDDGTARVWKRETGTQEAVLRRSEGPVLAVAWSPTLAETQIATGHADRMVRLWRPRVETPLRELPGHTGPVTCVVFTPDGGRLASGSKDGTCRIWHLAGAAPPTILGAGFGVWTLAFSPDVTRVIAAGGTYAIWNLETGKEERRDVRGGGPGSNIAAWSPAGRWIALGADFTVSFLDGESGESRPGFKAHQFYVSALSWSPDGSRLVSAATDHTLRVWDVSAGDQLWFTVFLPERQHAVFNAAGELLQKSGPEADEHLLYTIEKDDGSLEWLSPEAFLARVRDARKE